MNTKPDIKILLVDDREDNLFSIQTILEKDGYIFSKASSGKQALKILLKEFDFTLILMDVEMPELNGFETASLIYERDKLRHIPIIFITANYYSDEYMFKGYRAGAVDYIYKPINSDLLRAKVSVFVDLYKKNHLLLAQEQHLQQININLEDRVKERTEELLIKNQELEISNSQLKRVNNDLDNFIYTASHDLKSPVSNIEGLLGILKETMNEEKKLNDDTEGILQMIEKSVIKFKNTIIDLTEISKIQKGAEEDMLTINCDELLEDVKFSINEMIDGTGAIIKSDFINCKEIRFSKKNLKSIFYNLLSNAIKYRDPNRRPEIYISTKSIQDFIELTIKDNGIGMELKEDSKIFSMLKRLHDHVEGSGVGLYIVKRIIDNANGKILVESELGKGSVFKVYFRK